MGRAGDTSPGKDSTAYAKLTKFKRNPGKYTSPIPLEECPWCGTPFGVESFQFDPPGAMVGLCRQMLSEMEPYLGAGKVQTHHARLQETVRIFSERARIHDLELTSAESEALARNVDDKAQALLADWCEIARAQALLADWCEIARAQANQGIGLNYQKYEDQNSTGVLLRDFLDSDLAKLKPIHQRFRANRSMREVETPVDILVEQSPTGTN